MKPVIIFVFFGFIAFACGEECRTASDFRITTCAGGSAILCERPNDSDVGLCTCGTNEPCITREDCLHPNHMELNCGDGQRHCYDNRCICSMFPIPGK